MKIAAFLFILGLIIHLINNLNLNSWRNKNKEWFNETKEKTGMYLYPSGYSLIHNIATLTLWSGIIWGIIDIFL